MRDEARYEGLGLRIKNLVYISGYRQTLLRLVLVYLHRICLMVMLIVVGYYLICVARMPICDRILLLMILLVYSDVV